jgi:hypothetical protein
VFAATRCVTSVGKTLAMEKAIAISVNTSDLMAGEAARNAQNVICIDARMMKWL